MMRHLITELRLPDPDGFYEQLMEFQRDRTDEELRLANAKLILLLANHIGDSQVLEEAIELAGKQA